jgi:hypothetical protein
MIEDAATRAEYTLQTAGGAAAMHWVPALEERIAQKTWRSAAAEVLMRIKRQFAVGLSMVKCLEADIYNDMTVCLTLMTRGSLQGI